MFVSDWERFVIPSDVIVVGIENPENFRFIRQQRHLFESCLPGKRLLFVSRYPQSTDLRKWLMGISNPYVHFGDFDLAGIKIFLSEFHRYLPERSSYLIPSDIEERLKNGSTERFQGNYYENRHLSSDILELDRDDLPKYLEYLEKAELVSSLRMKANGDAILRKMDKLYLHNPNLSYVIAGELPNTGNSRETIFLCWTKQKYDPVESPISDFEIDGKTFEVGGRKKGKKQIQTAEQGSCL